MQAGLLFFLPCLLSHAFFHLVTSCSQVKMWATASSQVSLQVELSFPVFFSSHTCSSLTNQLMIFKNRLVLLHSTITVVNRPPFFKLSSSHMFHPVILCSHLFSTCLPEACVMLPSSLTCITSRSLMSTASLTWLSQTATATTKPRTYLQLTCLPALY